MNMRIPGSHSTYFPVSLSLMLIIGAALLLGACAEMESYIQQTSVKIERFINSMGDDEQIAIQAYEEGISLRKMGSYKGASEKFQEATDRSHPAATYALGLAYNRGEGVEADPEKAASLINKAADLGDPQALYFAGSAFFFGDGVSRDYKRAARYLGDSSVKGHPPSQYLLAECFANGWGVPKDYAWAARWYGKAARQGNRNGQFSYGVVHSAGLGLPKNQRMAFKWLTLAAKQGHGQAEKLAKAIGSRLTNAERTAALKQVASFAPGPATALADPPTVRYVQFRLHALGHNPGAVDGIMGAQTRRAITAFNGNRGHDDNDRLTPELIQALFGHE